MAVPNRVCVALTRARYGLYLIGNMGLLKTSEVWAKILATLTDDGAIGASFPATYQCQQGHISIIQVNIFTKILKKMSH